MIDCNKAIDFIKTFDEFCHNRRTCAYCHFFDDDFDKCKVKDFVKIVEDIYNHMIEKVETIEKI